MTARPRLIVGFACLALAVGGCREHASDGDHAAHNHAHENATHDEQDHADELHDEHGATHDDHDGHDTEEAGHDHDEHTDEGGIGFRAGRGLDIPAEVAEALGLSTVTVTERSLASETRITAHIFASKPQSLASAMLTEEAAALLEGASLQGARLVSVDRSAVRGTRLVDAVFTLDEEMPREPGDFVTISVARPMARVLSVPRTAVLDSATGTFVYVVNDGAYLRTPIKIGPGSGDFVAISEGVREGDTIVQSPVEQLWLAELRLTKGGGHSH